MIKIKDFLQEDIVKKKIFLRTNGRPVIFVDDLSKVTDYQEKCYCDGKTVVSKDGVGDVSDICCLMENGNVKSLDKLSEAFYYLYDSDNIMKDFFHLILMEYVQDKKSMEDYGFTRQEKKHILRAKDELSPIIKMVETLPFEVNRVKWGGTGETSEFYEYLHQINENNFKFDEIESGIDGIKAVTNGSYKSVLIPDELSIVSSLEADGRYALAKLLAMEFVSKDFTIRENEIYIFNSFRK